MAKTIKDLNKLIEYIIVDYDEKHKSGGAAAYSDEPILFKASGMKCYLPPKYLEMKKIAQNFDFYTDTEASIFYKQAKFMEDFEDDFEYDGVFARSFPTYRLMNDQQLRGYFSFRTKVRRGDIKKSCTSFAYVYCYELIHGIGTTDAVDGYNKLSEFCKNYGKVDSMFGTYHLQWLNDYVVYYNLSKSFLKDVGSSDFDEALGIISNPYSTDENQLFEALDYLSSYHYHKSKAYKTAPDDMRLLTCNVFKEVMNYYNKKRQKGFIESAFGRIMSGPYIMFKATVFYDHKRYQNYSYKISETLSYTCKQGHWSRDRLFGLRTENRELGVLFKNIDAAFRKYLGVKPEITRLIENKIYSDIILAELSKLNEIKKQRRFEAVTINFEKLSGIRAAAEITKEKLIVEDDTAEMDDIILNIEAGNKKTETETTIPESIKSEIGLDENELLLIICLLRGEEYASRFKEKGIMVSVLADAINNTLFDRFGDTVIEFDGDTPTVVEDYKEELKGMLDL